ncbi:MAG: hypothetical protein V4644_03035 [Patescibacteria group bacterium]
MSRSLFAFTLLLLLLPALAHAQDSLRSLTDEIVTFANATIVPLIYTLAILLFMIGMVRYFFLEQGEEGREKGKQLMLWGIIGFVVMFSVWGIVRILLTTLGAAGA